MSFIKEFFGNLFQNIKDYLVQEILAVGKDVLPLLDNPSELYKKLDLEDKVLKVLGSLDRTPANPDHLDLIPYVPSAWEKRVIRYAIRKVFVLSLEKIRDELKEQLDGQA